MNDPHNLKRFVETQNPVYERACVELGSGQKTGHWMWFIFLSFEAHPILGARLRECTRLVQSVEGRSDCEIFGYSDDLKFRSSMTLFTNVARQDQVFKQALEKHFDGELDPFTLRLL